MDPITSTSSTDTQALTPEQQAFVRQWSLGALLIPQIYFFAVNSVRDGFLLFIPFYNVYVWLRGAVHGRQRSWDTGEWKSFASFEKRQRLMDKAGLIIFAVIIAYVLFVISIMGAVLVGILNAVPADAPHENSPVTSLEQEFQQQMQDPSRVTPGATY